MGNRATPFILNWISDKLLSVNLGSLPTVDEKATVSLKIGILHKTAKGHCYRSWLFTQGCIQAD